MRMNWNTYPRRNSTTAVSKGDGRLLYPCRAETVEEICLASDFAVLEVGIAEFSNVYLRGVRYR